MALKMTRHRAMKQKKIDRWSEYCWSLADGIPILNV